VRIGHSNDPLAILDRHSQAEFAGVQVEEL